MAFLTPETLKTIFVFFGGAIATLLGTYFHSLIEEKRFNKEQIYRPMYNELSKVVDSGLWTLKKDDVLKTKWSDFDSYLRFKTQFTLRESLNEYEELLKKLTRLESKITGFARKNATDIFPEYLLEGDKLIILKEEEERENGGQTQRIVSMEVDKWLEKFGHILFLAEGPDDLYKNLIEYSESKGWGNEEDFRRWKSNHPNWNKDLWKKAQKSEAVSEHQSLIKERDEIRENTLSKAEELRGKLESEINSLF